MPNNKNIPPMGYIMEQDKVHPEFSKATQANQSSLKLIAAIIFCLASIIPTFIEAEADKDLSAEKQLDSAINNDLLAQNQERKVAITDIAKNEE